MRRVLVTVLLVLGLTGCAQRAEAPPPSTPSPTAAGAFGPAETAFVELVIATDDQAVKLLDAGARRAGPGLRELATDLAAARRAELAALHELLRQARVAYVNNHEGHDMPGMPTEPELTALAAAPDFDREFARLLRAHLTESATVAGSAGSLTHSATKAAAGRMSEGRKAELARLDQLGRG
ncbi:DUF305 domain-containing protein [Crossiella sp. NPDC003009]